MPGLLLLYPLFKDNRKMDEENGPLKKEPSHHIANSPKNRSYFINFFVQFAAVAFVFFLIGFAVGQKKIGIERRNFIPKITVSNQLPQSGQNIDFSLFWEVFNALPQKYFDKKDIEGQKLLYGAISGMVRSLGDPYTAFFDPKQNESVRADLSGSYEGVGIQIGFNDKKRLAVITPLKSTPAERAGVRPKDLILKISEKETFDLTLPEAVELIRGPAGSKIKLTLQHESEDKPYDIEVERAKISVKSVEVEYRQSKKGEVALLKVSRFGEQTDSEWDQATAEVIGKGVKGVVVDMRNNPGGLLTSSIHLASEFVRGTIVKQESADGSVKSLASDHEGKLIKIPVVVLVNGGSASAAEIFAGAIKDKDRGKIVGEKTFGKGSVQDAIELPGGSGLHITIAHWLTPDGSSIHEKGIEPDVKVELKDEDSKQNRDPQLEKALEII